MGDDIERMVKEAEQFKHEDDAQKSKVEARNEFERYVYSVRNTADREELKDKFSDEDRSAIQGATDSALKWLEENKEADTEEFAAKQKELEDVVNPIMVKVYEQAGATDPGGKPEGGD